MATKKYNHIHKFRRDRYSTGRAFYYCIQPDCNFKIDVKHSLGKNNICNKCGTIFTMNEYSIRAAKPICMNCVDRRSEIPAVNLDSILGVIPDANHVDRPVTIPSTRTTSDLQEKLNNVIIKEYNPEDDDLDL